MNITLDEARTLDAVVKAGSFAKAAENLGKSHSAIVYSLKSLESQTGLKLLDRSQYRTTLTPIGKRVWEESKRLLASEKDFMLLCKELSSGWEPYIRIVVDGIIPFEPILKALERLARHKIPTKIQVFAEFLSGVEDSFIQREADIMISVLPPQTVTLEPVKLCPVSSFLVAHKDHSLVQTKKSFTVDEMRAYPFLTVRGPDPRLSLSTVTLDECSTCHLNDFQSKKAAIMKGLGYGWLPEYLIKNELKKKTLKVIRWEKTSTHTLFPHLYHRGNKHLGRAGREFMKEFLEFQKVPRCEECKQC